MRLEHGSATVSPDALATIEGYYPETIREIEDAVRGEAVVVVGMAQNPHVKNVRQALDEAKIAYKYLEYGSYFGEWKRRLAIKMWSGWPTFPQVFVKGVLIGGEDLTKKALADGSLEARLGGKSAEKAGGDAAGSAAGA